MQIVASNQLPDLLDNFTVTVECGARRPVSLHAALRKLAIESALQIIAARVNESEELAQQAAPIGHLT